MLKTLRDLVCHCFESVNEISTATGISVDALRTFAFGKSTLLGYDLDQLATYFRLELVPQRKPDLLPLEAEASKGIQHCFARDFDYARDMLSFGLRVIGATPEGGGTLPRIQKPRGLTWPVVHLALGIYTKIMKQGRAVIALCELGLVKDAGAIERCMFEALLALQYLLMSRVKVKQNGEEITNVAVQTGKPDSKGQWPPRTKMKVKSLTIRMRALLYHARDCIRAEEELEHYLALNRNDLATLLGDQSEIRKLAQDARNAIGPAWAERQKQTSSYAGVQIKDLAQSYGVLDFYRSIYHRQSRTVHATDGLDFIDTSNGLNLDIGPSPDHVDVTLQLAASLLVGAIETLDERLGLGFKTEVKQRLKEIKGRGGDSETRSE